MIIGLFKMNTLLIKGAVLGISLYGFKPFKCQFTLY